MFGPPRGFDPVADAKRVKTVRRTRKLAARQSQCVDHAISRDRLNIQESEFRVEKSQVEFGIMRNDFGVADKLQEIVGDFCRKTGLPARNSAEIPCTRKASFGMSRSGSI